MILVLFLLFCILTHGYSKVCTIHDWQGWSLCTGECGHQSQWRIRYITLPCNDSLPRLVCLRKCGYEGVEGNVSRVCVNCTAEEWKAYLLKTNKHDVVKNVDCSSERVWLFVLIPMIVVAAMVGACCTYVCLRQKEKKRKLSRKRWDRADEEGVYGQGGASPHVYRKQRTSRINSIDVHVQSPTWGQW